MTKFKSSSYDESSEDLLQHCFNLKHLIESASQFKELSTEEFLDECTPFPFSLVKSPYVERKAIFDLETNGLPQFIGWNNVEILQIALVDAKSGNKYWNQYINPTKPISNGTTEKNHLTVGSNNRLFYKGKECENAVSASEGIERFRGSLCNRDAHEALGDCMNLYSAIKVAASRRNLSVSEFIGESSQKLSIYSF